MKASAHNLLIIRQHLLSLDKVFCLFYMIYLIEHTIIFIFQFYSFTMFSMMLNELRDEERPKLPPTDSRLRPDITQLEQGDLSKYSIRGQRGHLST